uniref:Anoctamin n=1 Tax=Rhabditophanes sp. KR3021 TaxID=114890 RepID=A0AC35U6X5_9BILA
MSEELKKRLEVPTTFNTQFIENHLKCYDNYQNKDQFFQRADRAWMVYDLLLRTGYNDGTSKKVQIGIERLLNRGTYCAAYPLHERLSRKDPVIKVSDMTDRELLFKHWGSFKAFFRFQPLDLIKRYFGTKFGLYFAWLGYYTKLLIFPAIIGLIVVIAGVSTYHNDIPSNDICGTDGIGSTTFLCPSCEKYCDFTKLSDSCFYSKLTYIFDNNYTVFFAIIMSIWATLFLEGWKRFHAELAWKWGLLDFEIEEEAMRPEFQLKIKTTKLNPVTGKEDPHIPGIQKIIRMICSGITVLFFVCLVLAFAFGIIFYRVICTYTLYKLDANNILRSNVTIVTSMTAASINLVVILSLNYMYTWLAVKLTEMECPRTQTEFDNSYCLKVFLFQWVNYFSSPLYIAFFKGRFNSVPNALDPTDLGSELQITPSMEQCDPAGCMVELVIQLAFIMCGKQFFSGFMEICYPFILNWRRKVKLPSVNSLRAMWSKHNSEVTPINIPIQTDLNSGREKILVKQYEKDFALNSVHHQYLFDEYLEMVIQFGFVTLFVTAFPLAPLFALINNVLEIRMDALKFLSANRRPVPSQSKNIGIWLSILDGISTFAVLVNASVIAFTSDFVPKLFYYFKYEKELYGYMDNSLSYFDASLLNMNITSNYGDVKVCRYRGYIQPTCHFKNKHPELFHANDDCNNEYIAKGDWWQILACRLAFILIFEHLVFVIKILFAYIIPDIPTHILLQLQREKFLNRQAVLNQHEMSKIKKMKDTSNISNSDLLKRAKAQVSSKDVIFESGQVTNEKDLMSSQLQEILTSKNNEASSRLPRKKMSSIVSHKYEEDPSIPGGIQENDNHLHSVSSLDSFYTAN